MAKARHLHAALLLAVLLMLGMGCELIAGVDRGKIDASNGGTGTTTGGGGTGGGGTGGVIGGGGTGGVIGGGGTGGTMCVPVDDNNECTDDLCDADNMPVHVAKAPGATCMNGGTQCDGNGNCVECLGPTDCPGEDNACQTRTCTAGACGFDFVTSGTAVPTQTAGDCKLAVCDGAGLIVDAVDDADLPDDNNVCTNDLCASGAPAHSPVSQGTSCGGVGSPLVCDGAGSCVGCNAANDCAGTDDECKQRTCVNQVCGVSFTAANTPVTAQTTGDCLNQVCDGNGNFTQIADDADVPADDGNACTNDTCAAGSPIHPNKTNGTSCNDSDSCTQTDTCQAGTCTGGDPVVCAAQDQCHDAGTCNPANGTCSNPTKANGAACNDGDACTQSDTCQAGACAGANPITCTASDQCHDAGTCNPADGTCSNPNKANGSACSDGDACTQSDTCQAGACTGASPVTCTAQDQCHDAGTCNPANGTCSNPIKANGSACSDGNACTQSDTCQAGACTGASPVLCLPQDQCHDAGTCNPADGTCDNPNKANGASCNDSDACTQTDTCQAGACTGANPVTCTASDQCHDAGTCNPANGTCSNPNKADGATCSDGDGCTQTDTCQAGACTGSNPKTCTALDQCHVAGTCAPATGTCSNPNEIDGTACMNGGTPGACANGVCGSCGDGTITGAEICDDGNFVSGDGCDNNCTPTACGNGIAAGAELCDDGNLVNGDGCDANCTLTACGNGVLTGSEICDDGNGTSGDGCDNNCTHTACGNGVVTGSEICDDGNGTSGDGCDANCTTTACGNGVVTSGEQCDDGNAVSGDGCDNNCTPTACGNGVLTGAETCDDGNTANLDGCTSKCLVEVPYACAGAPSICTSTKEINCNDGKDNDGDSTTDCADTDCALHCNVNVGACAAGDVALVYTATDTPKTIVDNTPAGVTSNITVGGIGKIKRVVMQTNIAHGFDADVDATLISSGNVSTDVTSDNGGSSANYTDTLFNTACPTSVTAGAAPFNGCFKPEAPFTLYNNGQAKGVWGWKVVDDASGVAGTVNSWRLALCVTQTTCGDGVADAGEACDDGNALNGDGCDTNCTVSACGNGIIGGAEACDDSNGTGGDGCSAACAVEVGYQCVGTPSVCAVVCGDGIVGPGEACDDGNTTGGDCCSPTCGLVAGCEVGPNDACGTASPITLSGNPATGSLNASISPIGDSDWFSFTLATRSSVRVETFVGGVGLCTAATNSADTKIELRAPDCSTILVTDDDDGVNSCSLVDPTVVADAAARALAPATYYVKAYHFANTALINLYTVQVTVISTCGNGVIEPSETCDDGNATAGDGCDSTCQTQAGYTCAGAPSVCTFNCGNGTLQVGETCDDNNALGGDGCSAACAVESGYTCVGTPSVCTLNCGNGTLQAGETCDDTNTTSGDGCSSACAVEPGYTCSGTPSVCPFTCGNGTVTGNEKCDDGNINNGDGCNSVCQYEVTPETEANNTCATANGPFTLSAVGSSKLLSGAITPIGDQDWYSFTLPSYADVKLETYDANGPVTCASIDTVMDLYAADCVTLLVSQDQGGVGNCSRLDPAVTSTVRHIPPGTYRVKVTDFLSDGTFNYTLLATVTAMCGNGVREGSEQCDGGANCNATCQWTTVAEAEPNDTTANADTNATNDPLLLIDSNRNITGGVSGAADKDIYKLVVAANNTVVRAETFDFTGVDCRTTVPFSMASVGLRILNSAGTAIVTDFESSSASGYTTNNTFQAGIGVCAALAYRLDAGTYYVQVDKTVALASYFLRVTFQTALGSEIEPNDLTSTATPAPGIATQIFGDHQVTTDTDFYAVTVPAGGSIRAEVIEGDNVETCELNGIDSSIALYNPAGTLISTTGGDVGRGFCSMFDGTGPSPLNTFAHNLAAGTYFVRVISATTAATPANQFNYRLVVDVGY